MRPTFSIIVPVYRIDYDLLRCCLHTLKSQDYCNVEYLIVDDGSPDDCGSICDAYAEKDSRFNVIHKNNEGVSVARNTGIEIAKGDYILFVDADDGLYPGFLRNLAIFILNNKSDMVFFNYTISNTDGSQFADRSTPFSTKTLPDPFTIAKAIVDHTDSRIGFSSVMFGAPWGKAIKRSFLIEHNLRFPVGVKKTQDRIFVTQVLSYKPTISHFSKFGYVYVRHQSSVCRRYNPEIMHILGDAEKAFVEMIDKSYFGKEKDELLNSIKYLRINYLFSSFPISFFHKSGNPNFGKQKEDFIDLCKEYREDIIKCHVSMMASKLSKVQLILLKLGLYNLTYIMLTQYYSR